MPDNIDDILKKRQAAQPVAETEEDGDKLYSVLIGEANQENFLELRFQNGLQTCFSYSDLLWFNHDPEAGCIDLECGGFLITVKGRGLRPIFNGIKNKRVAWIKEADSDLQDHDGLKTYIKEISITPPKGFTEEPAAEE